MVNYPIVFVCVKMRVKVPAKANMVQVGEPVEVLVVSDERSLSRFIAVHDVYLPNKRIWMSDSPCVEREAFEYISESLSFSSMQPAASQVSSYYHSHSGHGRMPKFCTQVLHALFQDSQNFYGAPMLMCLLPAPVLEQWFDLCRNGLGFKLRRLIMMTLATKACHQRDKLQLQTSCQPQLSYN